MRKYSHYFLHIYNNFITLVFLVFIFGTLCFGRAFSLFHINITSSVPIFLTELFLLLSFPMLLFHYKELLKLPKFFRVSFIAFILFSSYYLFVGILRHNLFALRDVVLCGYLLFFLLTFLIFSKQNMLRSLIIILIASNIINLFVGRLLLLNGDPVYHFLFLSQIKPTNFGLYYGMALSFLISFFPVVSKKEIKALMILLIATDIYMLIFFSRRTLWFAFLALLIYFIFINRFTFAKVLIKIAPMVIVLCILLFYFDFRLGGNNLNEKQALSKFKTMLILSSCSACSNKPSLPDSSVLAKDKISPVSPESNEKEGRFFSSANDKNNCSSLHETDIVNLGNIFWRFEIWKQSIRFASNSLLFGRGFGIYPVYVIKDSPLPLPKKKFIDSGVVPTHNELVSIFFKMGFVGLVLFLYINMYAFLYGKKYMQYTKDNFIESFMIAVLGCFIFWHAMALFFDIIDSPPTSIFLWILIGLIFGASEADKNEIKNNNIP